MSEPSICRSLPPKVTKLCILTVVLPPFALSFMTAKKRPTKSYSLLPKTSSISRNTQNQTYYSQWAPTLTILEHTATDTFTHTPERQLPDCTTPFTGSTSQKKNQEKAIKRSCLVLPKTRLCRSLHNYHYVHHQQHVQQHAHSLATWRFGATHKQLARAA